MGPFGDFPLLTVFVVLVIVMVVSNILFPKQRRFSQQRGQEGDRIGPPVCRACGEPQSAHALYCRRCGSRLK
jgi:uncharacterized paraquat-inducible protein A